MQNFPIVTKSLIAEAKGPIEIDKRIKFVLHKQRRVLLYDFTGLSDTEDALKLIDAAHKIAARQIDHSIYTLTDISGSDYDRTVTAALQELAKHNKPYVIAGAAVGVAGLQKVVFRSIFAFQGVRIFRCLTVGKRLWTGWLLILLDSADSKALTYGPPISPVDRGLAPSL